MLRCAALAAVAAVVVVGIAGAAARATPPLLGAMYSHFSMPACSLDANGIVAYLDRV